MPTPTDAGYWKPPELVLKLERSLQKLERQKEEQIKKERARERERQQKVLCVKNGVDVTNNTQSGDIGMEKGTEEKKEVHDDEAVTEVETDEEVECEERNDEEEDGEWKPRLRRRAPGEWVELWGGGGGKKRKKERKNGGRGAR